MSLLERIFGEKKERARLEPLYAAVVAAGREPAWYREGEVPDSVDGRFDIISAVLALVLLRMEEMGEAARGPSVLLTELFIDDMDRSLRQIGIGDYVVGKHVGRMMSALGGRLGAFREAIAGGGGLEPPVRRNIFDDAPPSPEAPQIVAHRLEALRRELEPLALDDLLAGRLKQP